MCDAIRVGNLDAPILRSARVRCVICNRPSLAEAFGRKPVNDINASLSNWNRHPASSAAEFQHAAAPFAGLLDIETLGGNGQLAMSLVSYCGAAARISE